MFIDYKIEDADTLARTIFGEARGEYGKVGLSGLIAVGNVIINRANIGGVFGKGIIEVCKKPRQFSCWNIEDPNFSIMKNASKSDFLFNICYEVATALLGGMWPDLTMGCDHYHANYIRPKWAENIKPKLSLGVHIFYKLKS